MLNLYLGSCIDYKIIIVLFKNMASLNIRRTRHPGTKTIKSCKAINDILPAKSAI